MANENSKDLAKRLETLRKMLGYSQRQIAKEFNVTPGAIANWESATRPIPGSVIRLIEIYEENLGMSDRPEQVLNKINAGWASRTLRSSLTSAKLLAKLAGGNLQQIIAGNERAAQIKLATEELLAQEVVSSLGQLKGLAMKFGQMMVYMNFALPKNVRLLLETLQDSSMPMSKDVVDKVFLDAFGKRPESIFAKWEAYPFAAASIGQVHRAELKDGTKVAVKVQYPDITKALKTDLKNVAVIEKFSQLMFRYQNKGAFIEELRERFLEECDYRKEAENTKLFRELFASNEKIVVPKIYSELSGETVLVTEFCEGLRLKEFIKNSTQEERDEAGETIFKFTFEGIFKHGLFNCDPNGGNFLFQKGKVVFLDFGCVKKFSKDFIHTWKKMSAAALDGESELLFKYGEEFGFYPRPELVDKEKQIAFLLSLYEPWLKDATYRFTQSYVENTWREGVSDNPNKYKLALPKDWVFTNRLQWGVCALLAELNATSNWRSQWTEYTEYAKYRRSNHAL